MAQDLELVVVAWETSLYRYVARFHYPSDTHLSRGIDLSQLFEPVHATHLVGTTSGVRLTILKEIQEAIGGLLGVGPSQELSSPTISRLATMAKALALVISISDKCLVDIFFRSEVIWFLGAKTHNLL